MQNKEIEVQGELFEFVKRSLDAYPTQNNSYEFFNSCEDFNKDLISKIKSAKKIILLEVELANIQIK